MSGNEGGADGAGDHTALVVSKLARFFFCWGANGRDWSSTGYRAGLRVPLGDSTDLLARARPGDGGCLEKAATATEAVEAATITVTTATVGQGVRYPVIRPLVALWGWGTAGMSIQGYYAALRWAELRQNRLLEKSEGRASFEERASKQVERAGSVSILSMVTLLAEMTSMVVAMTGKKWRNTKKQLKTWKICVP